jgi:hypothetical protein
MTAHGVLHHFWGIGDISNLYSNHRQFKKPGKDGMLGSADSRDRKQVDSVSRCAKAFDRRFQFLLKTPVFFQVN